MVFETGTLALVPCQSQLRDTLKLFGTRHMYALSPLPHPRQLLVFECKGGCANVLVMLSL